MRSVAKGLGAFLIASTWAVSIVVVVIAGFLLFLYADGAYLAGPQQTEVVTVMGLKGVSRTLSGELISRTYSVRFSSGHVETISFPSAPEFQPGDEIQLVYSRTRLRRAMIVREYARLPVGH